MTHALTCMRAHTHTFHRTYLSQGISGVSGLSWVQLGLHNVSLGGHHSDSESPRQLRLGDSQAVCSPIRGDHAVHHTALPVPSIDQVDVAQVQDTREEFVYALLVITAEPKLLQVDVRV